MAKELKFVIDTTENGDLDIRLETDEDVALTLPDALAIVALLGSEVYDSLGDKLTDQEKLVSINEFYRIAFDIMCNIKGISNVVEEIVDAEIEDDQ